MNYTQYAGKAMLSQPMAGKTDEEIIATREKAIAVLRELSGKDEFWIVNTVMGQTAVGWKIHFPHMDEV